MKVIRALLEGLFSLENEKKVIETLFEKGFVYNVGKLLLHLAFETVVVLGITPCVVLCFPFARVF